MDVRWKYVGLIFAIVVLILLFIESTMHISVELRYLSDPNYMYCMNLSDKNPCFRSGGCSHSDRNKCLFDLAQNYSDILLCEKMSEEKGSIFGSANLPFPYIGRCVGAIAVSKNDLGLCDRLSHAVSKDECNEVYAIKRFNYSICDSLINNGDERLYCLHLVMYYNRENITDWSICEVFPDYKHGFSLSCYVYAALETSNLTYLTTYCDKFGGERDDCLDEVADVAYDWKNYSIAIEACQMVTNISIREKCMKPLERWYNESN